MTGNSGQKMADRDRQVDIILILGTIGEVGQQLIEQLSAKNYRVRGSVEFIQATASNRETFDQVGGAICCRDPLDSEMNEQDFKNILELFKNYSSSETKILFDFTNPDRNLKEIWGAVDDVVMGGVSESNIRFVHSKAIFSGNVSIANNGGFASVRTRNFNPPLDLSNYQGIELRLEGDGKRYKFITRCEGKWDGLSYCHSFDTIYNFPQTIQIPFKDLIPVFRAKTVSDAGEFDASRVYSMQLMQSKFEYDGALNPRFSPGLFGLEIESIKAYGTKQSNSPFILATTKLDLATELLLKNSGLKYTIIRYSPNTPIEQVSQSCIQALENPELGNRRIEI